jgi:hypothetical protein
MRYSLRRVDSYSMEVPNRPGEAYRILQSLDEAGVNLVFFTAYPAAGDKAIVDLVVEDASGLLAALKAKNLPPARRTPALMVSGPERLGGAAEVLGRLADARINIHAFSGTAQGDAYGMVLWIPPSDFDAAARALGA